MITKAGLIVFRENQNHKQLLLVRAKGKSFYVLPGGKQEKAETVEEALRCELYEELGCDVTNATWLGNVEGATPDGRPMEMHLYSGELRGELTPLAEIEEICWMSKQEIEENISAMTPMTIEKILPFLEAHHL